MVRFQCREKPPVESHTVCSLVLASVSGLTFKISGQFAGYIKFFTIMKRKGKASHEIFLQLFMRQSGNLCVWCGKTKLVV